MGNFVQNFEDNATFEFDSLASEWWDSKGKLKTLHDINPVRLHYIKKHIDVAGKAVLDIGCGGGLLSEALAREKATVTGIDISQPLLQVATQHAMQEGHTIQYIRTTPEDFATDNPAAFDLITCMELLEHIDNPSALIMACMRLLKPGGWLFLSTINRGLKAYLKTVIIAEYLLKLLPVGTHNYHRYCRPSEVSMWCRAAGFNVVDISGLSYLPWLGYGRLTRSPDVNYLLCAKMAEKS